MNKQWVGIHVLNKHSTILKCALLLKHFQTITKILMNLKKL